MELPDFLTQDAYGEIRLTGHRIGLYTMIRRQREGRSAEEIAEEFPTLPLDLVRKVLAFHQANRAAVDEYVDVYRADLERLEAMPPSPGMLRLRHLQVLLQEADQAHRTDSAWQSLSVVQKLRRMEQETGKGAS
jgi:uncharacterized protein (DUF433 family)